jgi:hypothetical protein
MAFHITHLDGAMESGQPLSVLPALLDELEHSTADQPDVSVSHESGATLSVFGGGKVVFEDVESDDPPGHMDGLDRAAMLRLLTMLAEGRVDEIAAEPWRPGYGP